MNEINKLISIYGSISYFGKKLDEIASSNNPLELNVKKKLRKKFSKLSANKS